MPLTNDGIILLEQLLSGVSGITLPRYVGVGVGDAPITEQSTQLDSEVYRNISSSRTLVNNRVVWTMTIPAGVVEFVTITEVGLFVESEGGIMVAAASVNLLRQSGESTTINYRLDLHAREITP